MTKKLLLPDVKKILAKADKEGILSVCPKMIDQILKDHPKEYLKWTVTRNYQKED